MELKRMMEILGAPQTHVQLKDMIKEIDEDFDGSINFTEVGVICVITCMASRLQRNEKQTWENHATKCSFDARKRYNQFHFRSNLNMNLQT